MNRVMCMNVTLHVFFITVSYFFHIPTLVLATSAERSPMVRNYRILVYIGTLDLFIFFVRLQKEQLCKIKIILTSRLCN